MQSFQDTVEKIIENKMPKGYARKELEEQSTGAPARYANEITDYTGVNGRRTPEMMRTDQFQRLADIENNRLYYRPSITRFGTGTGTQVLQEGGVYQMPKMETEDMRLNQVNRDRYGKKLTYNELEKKQAADQVVQALVSMRGMNAQDIEKLNLINQSDLIHAVGLDEKDIRKRARILQEDFPAKEMMREAAARLGMNIDMLYTLLAMAPNITYGPFYSLMESVDMKIPGVIQEGSGQLRNALVGDNVANRFEQGVTIQFPPKQGGN